MNKIHQKNSPSKRSQIWRMTFFVILAILLTLPVLANFAQATDKDENDDNTQYFKTLDWDGQQWEWNNIQRVVSVGDFHGDFNAMAQILTNTGLTNAQGKWAGGKTHLVITGDMVDGAPDSRLILDFIMNLQTQAEKAGGKVHVLRGNHETLVVSGDLEHMSAAEEILFEGNEDHSEMNRLARENFTSPKSKYSKWLAGLNSMIKINDVIYTHAGVAKWALLKGLETDNEPGRINATARTWIRYWQGLNKRPPASTGWVVGLEGKKFSRDLGPSFERGFQISIDDDTGRLSTARDPDGPKRKLLKKILKSLGATRLVVGHAPVPDRVIHLKHPYYGESVIVIDTHMSVIFGGQLSALEIRNKTNLVAYQFNRYAGDDGELADHPLREKQWRLTFPTCEYQMSNLSGD